MTNHEIDVTIVKNKKSKKPYVWANEDTRVRFCKLRKVHVSNMDCTVDCRNRIIAGYSSYYDCVGDNLV